MSSLHCCVPGCNSDARYDEGIHFHTFPSDQSIRKQWTINIRREEGETFRIHKRVTVVCSKHFKKEDYRYTPVRKHLKRGTVPTIFDWSGNKPRRRPSKRKRLAETGVLPEKTLKQDKQVDVKPIATQTPHQGSETKSVKLKLKVIKGEHLESAEKTSEQDKQRGLEAITVPIPSTSISNENLEIEKSKLKLLAVKNLKSDEKTSELDKQIGVEPTATPVPSTSTLYEDLEIERLKMKLQAVREENLKLEKQIFVELVVH